jgi:hypothetical protein
MIKKIIALVFIAVTVISCKSNNAFKYSQEFVTNEKKLIPLIEITEKKVEGFISEAKYDSIAIVSEKLESVIEETIKDAKAKPAADAKDGEKFKADVIKYFEYLKSVYSLYKDYGNAGTEEGRQQQITKMQEILSHRPQVVSTIQTAQKDFAKSNGFKIEQ